MPAEGCSYATWCVSLRECCAYIALEKISCDGFPNMVHRASGSGILHAATYNIFRGETSTKYQNPEIEVKQLIVTAVCLLSYLKHYSNPGPKFQFLQRANYFIFISCSPELLCKEPSYSRLHQG